MRRGHHPRHRDRRIAVSDHAVDRIRERANVSFLDAESIRLLIAEVCRRAAAEGMVEPHYVPGQERVRVAVLGQDVYAILGTDLTGWGRGLGRRAVVTVLTPEQVEARITGGHH